jgi:hypothetical protein
MRPLASWTPFLLAAIPTILAQDTDGYTGYNLTLTGDNDSAYYETANTAANTSNPDYPPPDVYLNASVHVGEIDILVRELKAKVNIDAQALQLLEFNAGVDVSVERVRLNIQNVTARVELTARLSNLVKMIDAVLNSVDLNPILAELGDLAGGVIGGVGDAIGGILDPGTGAGSGSGSGSGSNVSTTLSENPLSARSLLSAQLQAGIIYGINDYSGNRHTNRVLNQAGELVDQSLDNAGFVYNSRSVGSYDELMTPTGRERTGVVFEGQKADEKEYAYRPFPGIEVVAAVYTDPESGDVLGTRLISELEGGGSSTISNDEVPTAS